jgi:hypothetical protein
VSLFDQGLTQVLQASVTGLEPKRPYVLGLSDKSDGNGSLQPLAAFTTNLAGAAIVNALGPIRQVVQGQGSVPRRYLVIVPGTADQHGAPVQVQVTEVVVAALFEMAPVGQKEGRRYLSSGSLRCQASRAVQFRSMLNHAAGS